MIDQLHDWSIPFGYTILWISKAWSADMHDQPEVSSDTKKKKSIFFEDKIKSFFFSACQWKQNFVMGNSLVNL